MNICLVRGLSDPLAGGPDGTFLPHMRLLGPLGGPFETVGGGEDSMNAVAANTAPGRDVGAPHAAQRGPEETHRHLEEATPAARRQMQISILYLSGAPHLPKMQREDPSGPTAKWFRYTE